jgi:hypothetical protein
VEGAGHVILCSRSRAAIALCLLLITSNSAVAQESKAPATSTTSRPSAGTIASFLGGAALGLAIHESGHVGMALIFDANPGLKGVSFGPIPFFAITHDPVSPGREYAISAAGFWMQAASSEWILTRRPRLRDERAPVAKGILAFHVLASAAYAFAAVAGVGPDERDTLSMARTLRWKEGWVGAMVIAPAALDVWRYRKPEAKWAAWASRAAKVGLVIAVARAAN